MINKIVGNKYVYPVLLILARLIGRLIGMLTGFKSALLIVDVLNDFIEGTLPVPDGAAVVPVINRLLSMTGRFKVRVAVQDWHPEGHVSFRSAGRGGTWPDHCKQNEWGSRFHKDLLIGLIQRIFRKGNDIDKDSYSGFGNIWLALYLLIMGVREVYVVGLATDYCDKATALDAYRYGFKTYFIYDAGRAVNVKSGDEKRALDEMRSGGVTVIHSRDLTPTGVRAAQI